MENNQEQDFSGTQIVERSAVEAIERAQIDIQIATAQRYPKHAPEMMSRVKANMLSLATLDEETAASCFYTLPRGGKAIQGESVRLTEIAAMCYGNSRIATRIIEICTTGTEPHVVIQGVAHDLENNTAYSAETRRRITKKKFKETIDEDDIQLATQACSAIAGRNATLKMIPKAFIRPIMFAAKKVAVGDVKSLAAKRQTVIDRLKAMGIMEDRILAVVGCLKVEDIGVEALGNLIGLGTALKDGETTIEEAFPIVVDQKPGVEGLKERLKKGAQKNTAPATESPKQAENGADPKKAAADAADLAEVNTFSNPPAEKPTEGVSDAPKSTDAGPTDIPAPERYYCPACEGTFGDAKGKNKTICPDVKCLSTGVIDRWKKP
jgi:hypothetical protein